MAFRIITTDGYNIVTDPSKARELISVFRDCGIYRGMQFLPYYRGGDCHG